jgi:hypothetical protein
MVSAAFERSRGWEAPWPREQSEAAPRRIRRPRSSRSDNSLGLISTLRSGSHRIASHLQERISPAIDGVPEELLTLLVMRLASLGTYAIG